jgi:hypothetical protein
MPQEKECKRPRSITILSEMIFLFSCLYLTRLVMTISQWDFLSHTLLKPSPIYLVISGLVFGMIGFPLAVSIWRGSSWAWRTVRLVIPIYLGYYWLERIILSSLTLWSLNWLFIFGVTVIVLLWTCWTISRPDNKAYFREKKLYDYAQR